MDDWSFYRTLCSLPPPPTHVCYISQNRVCVCLCACCSSHIKPRYDATEFQKTRKAQSSDAGSLLSRVSTHHAFYQQPTAEGDDRLLNPSGTAPKSWARGGNPLLHALVVLRLPCYHYNNWRRSSHSSTALQALKWGMSRVPLRTTEGIISPLGSWPQERAIDCG